MNKINRMISNYNYNPGNISRIKYIVIHYVGALGGAQENCSYYGGGNRGASAHYFVGFAGEIWQCVEDRNIAWHCGASSYKHPECRNANSIGIEMCVRKKNAASLGATDKDWYFEETTVQSAIELTRYLMKKYNIPADHVIRHYDVTGKICPNPYVYNTDTYTWDAFKKAIPDRMATFCQRLTNHGTVSARPGKTPAVRSGHLKRSRKQSSVQISTPVIMSTMMPERKYTHQVSSHTRCGQKPQMSRSERDRRKLTDV